MGSWLLFLFITYLEINFNILKSSYLLVEIEGGNETKVTKPVQVASKISIIISAAIRN